MTVTVLHGDCREVLRTLEPESVHCVVTSPPYFGLRDYGVVGQIGLEPTPDEYTAELVAVFAEVRRVLRQDGTVWLNIGDSYSGSGKGGNPDSGKQATNKGSQSIGVLYGKTGETARQAAVTNVTRRLLAECGIPPKQLLMIPARVALALQADGWWLRSDIIWAKPNPMPESVTDRPTSAHEHIFLLAKSERYWFDADAVAEPAIYVGETGQDANGFKNPLRFDGKMAASHKQDGHGRRHAGFNARWDDAESRGECKTTRNIRNVWTIATSPYPEAHFATFPPDLAERCIKAGTSEKGCCPQCGAPWERVTAREEIKLRPNSDSNRGQSPSAHRSIGGNPQRGAMAVNVETLGWKPGCQCEAGASIPCVVLDPFGGAGTTGLVADRLQRNAILIELNPDYVTMAQNRIRGDAPLFAI